MSGLRLSPRNWGGVKKNIGLFLERICDGKRTKRRLEAQTIRAFSSLVFGRFLQLFYEFLEIVFYEFLYALGRVLFDESV